MTSLEQEAFFDVLTAPPAASNGWLPLPMLTWFSCNSEYSASRLLSRWRLLLLPALTSLGWMLLAALTPDFAPDGQPQPLASEIARSRHVGSITVTVGAIGCIVDGSWMRDFVSLRIAANLANLGASASIGERRPGA